VFFLLLVALAATDHCMPLFRHCPASGTVHQNPLSSHSGCTLQVPDIHEDLTVRSNACILPRPVEFNLSFCTLLKIPLVQMSLRSVWQPPD
jgi:hypothetical protein